jgi:hypothetical protein
MIGIPRLFQTPILDVKLGFALMRDRRIPLRSKLAAILLGLAITGLVEFLELPVEGVLSAVLPILGLAGDAVLDGAELIAGPFLLAHLLLPFIAPRHLVDKIRAERAAPPPTSPIIDV